MGLPRGFSNARNVQAGMTGSPPDPAAAPPGAAQTPHTGQAAGTARQAWLAVLAHAPREALLRCVEHLPVDGFERLRGPEVGLTMLRARIANRGDRFNVGEATLTRCVVRHRGSAGRITAGVGYVLGRDPVRAEWVARVDALLQEPERRDALMRDVIDPLRRITEARRSAQDAQTAASRVRFHTLQSEGATRPADGRGDTP